MRRVEVRRVNAPPSSAGPVEAAELLSTSLLVVRCPRPMSAGEVDGAKRELARIHSGPVLVLPHGYDFEVWETEPDGTQLANTDEPGVGGVGRAGWDR